MIFYSKILHWAEYPDLSREQEVEGVTYRWARISVSLRKILMLTKINA